MLVSETEMELCCNKNRLGSHASVARVVTRPTGWRLGVRIPAEARDIYVVQNALSDCGNHQPASFVVATGGSFLPGVWD